MQTAATTNLIVGNGAMVLLSAIAASRLRAYDLVPFSLLNPAYWVLHSLAAWRAPLQLVGRTRRWEKTPHGILRGPEAHLARRAA